MLELQVSGMTCDHCVAAVTRAVQAVPAVEQVTVDLAQGRVAVQGDPQVAAVRAAIEDAGYEVTATA